MFSQEGNYLIKDSLPEIIQPRQHSAGSMLSRTFPLLWCGCPLQNLEKHAHSTSEGPIPLSLSSAHLTQISIGENRNKCVSLLMWKAKMNKTQETPIE